MKLLDCLALHAYDLTKKAYRTKIKEIKKEWEVIEWNDGVFLFKGNEFDAFRGMNSKNWLRDGIPEIKKIAKVKGLKIIKTKADEHMGKVLEKNGFYKEEGVYKCVI